MPEPELVWLGAPVHAGERTEDGIHDEVRAAGGEEQKRGNCHADGYAQGCEVVTVGGFQPVKGAHLLHQKLHAAPFLLGFRIPFRPLGTYHRLRRSSHFFTRQGT